MSAVRVGVHASPNALLIVSPTKPESQHAHVALAATVPKSDGSGQAIGTVLTGSALESIKAGKAYHGEAPVLGTPSGTVPSTPGSLAVSGSSRAQDTTQLAWFNPVIPSINPPTAHPVLCVETMLLQFWDGPR
jgi:hypothetical protein